MVGRSGTGGGLVTGGSTGKFVKARRGDIGVVCSLTGEVVGVGEEEVGVVGDCGRLSKEDNEMSRDVFEISTVGDNKDNLAKCADGEETDAGDAEAGVFVVFLILERGGTGGGGMMAESGMR